MNINILLEDIAKTINQYDIKQNTYFNLTEYNKEKQHLLFQSKTQDHFVYVIFQIIDDIKLNIHFENNIIENLIPIIDCSNIDRTMSIDLIDVRDMNIDSSKLKNILINEINITLDELYSDFFTKPYKTLQDLFNHYGWEVKE